MYLKRPQPPDEMFRLEDTMIIFCLNLSWEENIFLLMY